MECILLEDIRKVSEIAYQFLKENDLISLPDSRYDLSGGIYVNIESYQTQPRSFRRYESHRKYIDIQYMISGTEIISVSQVADLTICENYSPESDAAFYKNSIIGKDFILESNEALILCPSDGHMPRVCLENKGPETVKKAVIKIPVILTKDIRVLVMDVDGTLTDGNVYIGEQGEFCKAFNIKDGYGIRDILIPSGIIPIILTGRKSKILENRCQELGITEIHQDVSDKLQKLHLILNKLHLDCSAVAYIGDDINDLPCMSAVKASGGLVACPKDAVTSVQNIADYICNFNGGNGAVRELIEWII